MNVTLSDPGKFVYAEPHTNNLYIRIDRASAKYTVFKRHILFYYWRTYKLFTRLHFIFLEVNYTNRQ